MGQGFAEKFADLGCKVACVDIDEAINTETVNLINEKYPGRAKSYTCNVIFADEIKAVKEAVKKDFGDVDILVHNAGLVAGAPITEVEDIYLHAMIGVNLTSHFLVSICALISFNPSMAPQGRIHSRNKRTRTSPLLE